METTVNRIGIAGSHSCGKTTLLHELSKQLPDYPTVGEVASFFPRTTRRYMETQCAIMRMQIECENRHPLMISDRTVMDNIAYTDLCYAENNFRTIEDTILLKINQDRYHNHMMHRPYDLIAFVDEILPLEDNDSRCLNPFYQELIYNDLKGIVSDAYQKYGGFEILYVKGNTRERMQTIISYLTEH
jgi:uridine kinase